MYKLNIKKYRLLKNMTQEELANKSGLTQSYIAKLEKENVIRTKHPNIYTLEKISNALNICLIDIIDKNCDECNIYNDCDKIGKE